MISLVDILQEIELRGTFSSDEQLFKFAQKNEDELLEYIIRNHTKWAEPYDHLNGRDREDEDGEGIIKNFQMAGFHYDEEFSDPMKNEGPRIWSDDGDDNRIFLFHTSFINNPDTRPGWEETRQEVNFKNYKFWVSFA